jgi:hypothetical protein
MIEHIMRDAKLVGDRARVADVLPRTACPRTLRRLAVIIELERHADGFRARPSRQRRDH